MSNLNFVVTSSSAFAKDEEQFLADEAEVLKRYPEDEDEQIIDRTCSWIEYLLSIVKK